MVNVRLLIVCICLFLRRKGKGAAAGFKMELLGFWKPVSVKYSTETPVVTGLLYVETHETCNQEPVTAISPTFATALCSL
jgi:hypothetical protein